jgi:hypothetical protein
MLQKLRHAPVLALVVVAAVAAASCRSSAGSRSALTSEQVSRIRAVLEREDGAQYYRVNLPVFEGERITGSRTQGSLPLERVRAIASTNRVTVREAGYIHAMWSGADDGKGPNSHHTTRTRRFDEIREILRSSNSSSLVWVRDQP